MKNCSHRKAFLIWSFIISVSFNSVAQIPAGYYNTANDKSGYTLKTALYNIIKGHNTKSYAALWTLYKTSDKKPNGKVWDMYSDVPGGSPAYEYTFVSDQCGNYSGEGSCYNREHSFPKSWFNDASPMTTDPFHIVPSDGYVNGKRNNYPYGEVGSATFTSTNGSKLGASNYPGYSGTVFEPIDAYKGDFARGYFYMATRYENLIAGWEGNNTNGNAMLNGTPDQVYEDWALEMLIAWHKADPVTQKEIDRNDAIYSYQGNRNPFIDHPEYVTAIWGGGTSLVSEFNFSYSTSTLEPLANYEVKLYADIAPENNVMVRIKKAANSSLVYEENYTTVPTMENDVIELEWMAGELKTSFLINFKRNENNNYPTGSLNFIFDNPSAEYTIGAYNIFELIIEDDLINSISDKLLTKLNVYPNPSSSQICIDWQAELFNFFITDLAGKTVKSGSGHSKLEVDLSPIKTGQYVLEVSNAKGRITRKLTIY